MNPRIAAAVVAVSIVIAGFGGATHAAAASPSMPTTVIDRLKAGPGCVAIAHIFPNLEQNPCVN